MEFFHCLTNVKFYLSVNFLRRHVAWCKHPVSIRMLRLWRFSGFGCKEEWVKPDRPTAPHPGQWHHWGLWFQRFVHGAHLGRRQWPHGLSFLLPSYALLLQPPESPSKPILCPTRTPFCTILDNWITYPMSHLSLRVEREFKVTYASHSKHEYLATCQMVFFPFAYTLPSKMELATSTVRQLWLLEYHPCVESNSVSQYLHWTTLKE